MELMIRFYLFRKKGRAEYICPVAFDITDELG